MSSRRFDGLAAYEDLALGLRQLPFAYQLAMHELRVRYAQTALGPFWITITTGAWTLIMGVVFGGLFGASLRDVLPWITLGILAWTFLSQTVVESSTVLPINRGLLMQGKMSISMFVALVVIRNLIIAAHNMVIFVLLAIIFQLSFSWSVLYLLFTLPTIVLLAFGAGLIAAVTGTRFRDLPPLYGSLATMGMPALPIMWRPTDLQHYRAISDYNPLTYVLAAFRDPLLGSDPGVSSLMISLGSALVILTTGTALLARTRRRITLWL